MSREIGIDIVEFEEIKERLTDRFIQRILSKREQERYFNMKNTNSRIAYLAGRFAAKEAYTKVYRNFLFPSAFNLLIISGHGRKIKDTTGPQDHQDTERKSIATSHHGRGKDIRGVCYRST